MIHKQTIDLNLCAPSTKPAQQGLKNLKTSAGRFSRRCKRVSTFGIVTLNIQIHEFS